jgi:hypothetical protein
MLAHLEGCPACREEHDLLLAEQIIRKLGEADRSLEDRAEAGHTVTTQLEVSEQLPFPQQGGRPSCATLLRACGVELTCSSTRRAASANCFPQVRLRNGRHRVRRRPRRPATKTAQRPVHRRVA